MKITCSSCQQQFNIEDAKVPSGTFKIKCPKCSNVITAQKTTEPIAAAVSSSATSDVETFVKKEIAEAKRELLSAMSSLLGGMPVGGSLSSSDTRAGSLNNALICDADPVLNNQISNVLKQLGYSVESVSTLADAIKKLDHSYALITINAAFPDDKEGGAKIIAKLNGQKAAQRRETFVIYLSEMVKSADATAAFLQGANLIVNKSDIGRLDQLIGDGQRYFQQMYQSFRRALAEKEA